MTLDLESLFDRDQERRARATHAVLFAAQATPRWFYSNHYPQIPKLQDPLKVYVAADIGLGIVWLRYEGDDLVATAEWWPWRDVEDVHLHAVSTLGRVGSARDSLRLTIRKPSLDLEESGPAGIALSSFAGEVLRSVNGVGRPPSV